MRRAKLIVTAIRDSENPAGPILTIAPAAFTTLVSWTAATAAE
ncbi:DUF397 domain-containing protein [Streptomyces sp. MMG1533]|nr:DUF397 domain-containing protein [Streptomyces sp. MMG1533]